jgi:hypothetical protein
MSEKPDTAALAAMGEAYDALEPTIDALHAWIDHEHERAERAEAKVQRVRNALFDEWGMASIDGTPFDEDFAEAIQENCAWRLARDLRVALADPKEGESDA